MKMTELSEKIGAYLTTAVASQMTSPVTKFALGAAASVAGRRVMEKKLEPLVALIADENGEFSAIDVEDMLIGGIQASGPMQILGGLLTVNENDVRVFCGTLQK